MECITSCVLFDKRALCVAYSVSVTVVFVVNAVTSLCFLALFVGGSSVVLDLDSLGAVQSLTNAVAMLVLAASVWINGPIVRALGS